jgi:predicted ABC-type ATPase
LTNSFALKNNKVILSDGFEADRLAQIIARFLREELLVSRRRFSFETVFSHESNLHIMKRAVEVGYKVYLYFVSTESPEINKYRVKLRVGQGGHTVPEDKIESRYYRSLGLLKEAAEIAYQAFFFDNSMDNQPYKLIGHFKKIGSQKRWDKIEDSEISNWFKKYYSPD